MYSNGFTFRKTAHLDRSVVINSDVFSGSESVKKKHQKLSRCKKALTTVNKRVFDFGHLFNRIRPIHTNAFSPVSAYFSTGFPYLPSRLKGGKKLMKTDTLANGLKRVNVWTCENGE